MSDIKWYASEAAAIAQHAAVNRALGYPKRGTPVGPGPHVAAPDEPTSDPVLWGADGVHPR